MSKNVFANGREVSCKKDDNKSIAAMADTCLSPPSPPAGPVPIPYPNTAQASDTSDGSKTVKIGGDEVGKKNSSNYKKSTGDEAATKSLGMGVVTHTIQGKMKHSAWSMDVKIEDANAIRHMDMTTHNHMNCPNIALTLNNAGMAQEVPEELDCEELDRKSKQVEKEELESGAVQPGQTMAVASYQNPPGAGGAYQASGGNSLMKGASHGSMIKDSKSNGWSNGRPWRDGGYNSRACGYGGTYNPASCGHAEARITEEVFTAASNTPGVSMPMAPIAAPGLGTLTLNVTWAPSEGGTFQEPCGGCRNLICEAQACGLEIKICVNGDAQDPPCEDGKWTGDEKVKEWAGPRKLLPTT
jgi:Toxin PAAR-like domain